MPGPITNCWPCWLVISGQQLPRPALLVLKVCINSSMVTRKSTKMSIEPRAIVSPKRTKFSWDIAFVLALFFYRSFNFQISLFCFLPLLLCICTNKLPVIMNCVRYSELILNRLELVVLGCGFVLGRVREKIRKGTGGEEGCSPKQSRILATPCLRKGGGD